MLKMGMDDCVIQEELETEDTLKTPPFSTNAQGKKVVNKKFLQKYLEYAKKMIKPVMSSESVEFVSQCYAALRAKGNLAEYQSVKKLPITVRTLETLIRLGTAHAKLRLSKTVDPADLQAALKLLNFCIFNEDDDQEEQADLEVEAAERGFPKQKTRKAKRVKFNHQEDEENEAPNTRTRATRSAK